MSSVESTTTGPAPQSMVAVYVCCFGLGFDPGANAPAAGAVSIARASAPAAVRLHARADNLLISAFDRPRPAILKRVWTHVRLTGPPELVGLVGQPRRMSRPTAAISSSVLTA